MRRPSTLQLYVLRHPEVEQAAWVRANTLREACTTLSNHTGIPVVIPNDYGWVLFPEEKQYYTDDQFPPLPHWEFLAYMGGPADLKCMPEHIRALREKGVGVPWRSGKATLGRKFVRSTPLNLRSVPAPAIVRQAEVCHSGYRHLYRISADQLLDFPRDMGSITIGKIALLELEATEEARSLEVGDTVRMQLTSNQDDVVVIGQIARKAVIMNVMAIENM